MSFLERMMNGKPKKGTSAEKASFVHTEGPKKGESVFGEVENAASKGEGWKMPTVAERREKLQSAAKLAYEGKGNPGAVAELVAEFNEYGFRDTYGDDHGVVDLVNAHALRGVLGMAAHEAEAAFKGLQKGAKQSDENAYNQAKSIAPKEINRKYMRRIAELVYPTQYEGTADDGHALPNPDVDAVEDFVEEKMNLALVAEVTARQLGMKVPASFSPEKTYDVISQSSLKEKYGLEELKDFMSRPSSAEGMDIKQVLLTDMLLRLANSTWAGGQVRDAQVTEQPKRLERATFNSPEGRQQGLYAEVKAEFGEELAFYAAVFENAKDYLQYVK